MPLSSGPDSDVSPPAAVYLYRYISAVEEIEPQAEPVQANIVADTEFQYKAPVIKALPSLSNVGGVDLAPRYLSSKESYEAAAEVAEDAAEVALVDAAEADAAAALVEAAADAADVAALLADVKALDA